MSVYKSEYVILGYVLNQYAENANGETLQQLIWDDERYLPLSEGWQREKFRIIDGGMMDKPIVFGKELAHGDKYSGMELTEIELSNEDFENVKERAIELFSDFNFNFDRPKIISFSHYS